MIEITTEQQIFNKLKDGQKPPIKVIGKIVQKPMAQICVKPHYVYGKIIKHPTKKGAYQIEEDSTNDPHAIVVISGNTHELKQAGVTAKYGGWAYEEKRGNTTRREIFINNEMHPTAQMLTLAHETGHHVLKDAVYSKVGHKQAEQRAKAFEHVFAEQFNKRYAKHKVAMEMNKTGEITATIKERKFVKTNIKPIFLNLKCKRDKYYVY